MSGKRFIVSLRCRQMKAFDGTIMTPEDTEVWLCTDDGYASTTTRREWAETFTSVDGIEDRAKRSDGMPWYHRFKPGTIKIEDVSDDYERMSKAELIKLLKEKT